ncbi:putative hydrolase [Nocardia brasiliensis NBRC 14402]|uniref:alpha/beta fold hydrolase n=1 Tax=Nocardia brasiliensis TaxID=37326 RepID=UPI000306FA20|nr:alpha/beta fold hydrolase [Nocardia brasiliensis]ASF08293.1 alpha/beta hydrolase [Nocardia brasiliensis]GAJ79966.1 putative hydrolase [Nocardia brasiliensis NBRC 14402]SUB41251.1 Soluble epoxide hydrolase [Nocardia brasiliensis]
MTTFANIRPSRILTATDGVQLAVYESGPAGLPTALLVHGWPDDHRVWDGVVALLTDRFRVVTYDVRGAGNSERPNSTAAYRIPQLVADLAAVLDAVAPDGAHLLAHDWGSIFAWDALADPEIASRIKSFTSISGPSLDMIGSWLRGIRRNPRDVLTQMRHSFYALPFQLPALPEFAVRRGLVSRIVAASSVRGEPETTAPHTIGLADTLDGIALYRANMARRVLFPKPRPVTVPVQVLAPRDDIHVSVACQTEAPRPFATNLRTHEIDGNHWVLAQRPAVIARWFGEFAGAHR